MRSLTNLLLLAAFGILLSQQTLAQLGGGFGAGGGFGGEEEEEEQQEIPLSELIEGRWDIEFRIEYFSADPEATGRYLEVQADMFVSGDQIEGRIREQNLFGEFRCMYDGKDRCQYGTMRFEGEDQDWQDFGFVLDRSGRRATGWAEWINVETGEIQRYELRLAKH
jgi:hypothetical protein